jgi:diguanylate cyclase (GGDEF)-like protein/PAS domain S-box-containing protein
MAAEDAHRLDAIRRELHREGDRFRALLDAAPVAILIVNGRGEIVLVNGEAERMFDYHEEELLGQEVEVLMPTGARARHHRQRRGFSQQRRPRRMGGDLELAGRRKDGNEFPVEIGLGPVETEDGLFIVCTLIDLSERKRAQTTNARLSAILQHSRDAIIGVTLDGVVTSWSPGAEQVFGYSAEEAVGRHIRLVCPSIAAQQEIDEIMRQVARGGGLDHFETTRRHKDGHLIDVSVSVSPIHDHDTGAVIGAVAVDRDITPHRRAMDALSEAEERFRGAFERAPIGMALIDVSTGFTRVNEALCQVTGYDPEQLEGIGLEQIMHPDEVAEFVHDIARLADGERKLYAAERRLLSASGHPVWVALQVSSVPGPDGQPVRLLAQVQDITDRKRYEDRLQDLADHDSLTGLLNRHSFARELESHASLVAGYGAEGALLMLDLDHFKYVNDTLGHQAGDEIIARVSALLAARLRESDVIARLGGDEFAILLPKADAKSAAHVASDLVRVLTENPIIVSGVKPRAITASVGVASFEPQLSGEDVLVNADLAMYDAKEGGRNRVAIYESEERDQVRMKGRLSWVARIHAALDENRFSLLAQPIVDYSTGRTSAHELLIRMTDEHGDLIPPGAFLQIAERLDLIQQVDAWVIRRAVRMLAEDQQGGGGLPLHVNLSGYSIGDPEILKLIEEQIATVGVAPERLIFEVTETAAIRQLVHARRFGERLNELGCGLALDDFGAGFGSFYYIKHLPFDFLKIDGEFVSNCRASKTDRLVIEAVVAIARGLGKKTIAEYVGDEETVRLLTRLGVDYGQGFHHGRPGPISTSPRAAVPRA